MLIPNGEFSVVGCRVWNKRSNLQLFLWSLKRPKFWNNETYCLIRPVRSHILHLFQGANLGKALGSTGTPHNSKRKSAHGLNPNLALLGKRGDEDVWLNANAAAHRRRDKSVTKRHLRKRKRGLRTFPFVSLTPGPPGRPDYRRLDLGRLDCHAEDDAEWRKWVFPFPGVERAGHGVGLRFSSPGWRASDPHLSAPPAQATWAEGKAGLGSA